MQPGQPFSRLQQGQLKGRGYSLGLLLLPGMTVPQSTHACTRAQYWPYGARSCPEQGGGRGPGMATATCCWSRTDVLSR